MPFELIVKWYLKRSTELRAPLLVMNIEVNSSVPSKKLFSMSGRMLTWTSLNTNDAPVVGLVPTACQLERTTTWKTPVPVHVC